VRFYDATDPSKIVKLPNSALAPLAGARIATITTAASTLPRHAPDETFIHQPSYFRELVNGNMVGRRFTAHPLLVFRLACEKGRSTNYCVEV